jgi:AcrR family transcriptional regulator
MNETVLSVRQRRPSDQVGAGDDRRTRRTKRALTGALLELVNEGRYEAVTIQRLLNHADIGRSTFYAHYRSKDDLLLRSFERMLEGLDQALRQDRGSIPRVAPVRELFRHVGQFPRFYRALERAGMLERIYQIGTDQISRAVARRLASQSRGAGAVPLPVLAQGLAGALFALLRWWMDHDAPYSPEQMDEMYHRMALLR